MPNRARQMGETGEMAETGETAAPLVPQSAPLEAVRAAARGCRACHLWKLGTQTVFGVGPDRATVMLIGEVPGDREDREGVPFVGPAGELLDAALAAAGIDRAKVYITNVVKHFKWERAGGSPRRLHKKPNAAEITACRPWLDSEIAHVRPRVIVCLGATAAQALLGRAFRVTKQRGVPVPSPLAPTVLATWHPAAVLRAPDPDARQRAEGELFADLASVARYLHGRA